MKIPATILGAIAAFALIAVPACDDKKDDKKADDKKSTETKTETKDGKTKTETKTEEVKTTDAAKPAEGGGGADKIGVPECDEYIEKYSKCIMDKMPEASRQQMKDAMDQSAKAWKEAAAGPGKDSLAAGCKAALDAAKQSTASMGCEW